MTTEKTFEVVTLPFILTANTFYWKSQSSAGERRRNEERYQKEVTTFFEKHGFEVTREGETVHANAFGLEVFFSYSESCKNVYKSLTIYKDGKKSNITALYKALNIR